MNNTIQLLPSKKKVILFVLGAVLILIIAVLIWIWTAFGTNADSYECTNDAMNMHVQQTLYGNKGKAAASAAAKSIGELDNLISWNNDTSDIAKLNSAAGSDWTVIDSRTVSVLQKCLDVAEKSNGAYDPTIMPVYLLWDFGGSNQQVPSKDDIRKFLPYVNYQNLRVDTNESSASLKLHYMAVNLESVCKGAACTAAVAAYKSAGADSGIVSVGGNVGVFGTKSDRSAWHIAVRDPKSTDEKATAIGSLDIASGYASTVNSYEKRFVQNGVTYYNILNPKTGYPENNGLVSVTVTQADGVTADALANACFVLGIEKGMGLLKQYNAGGIFIDNKNQITVTDNLKSSFHLTAKGYEIIK